ncbi:MAG: phenylalanine--tRNA ligase subunit alpha [Candidatus Methanomethylicaceae archaeon]
MSLSRSEIRLLESLKKLGGKADAASLAAYLNEPASSIYPLSSLLKEKGYVETREVVREWYELMEEGRKCEEQGLPETRLYNLLVSVGGVIGLNEVKRYLDDREISAALGWGRRSGVFEVDRSGASPKVLLKRKILPDLDGLIKKLSKKPERATLSPEELDLVKELERRGLVTLKSSKTVIIELIKDVVLPEATSHRVLTSDLIKSGRWRDLTLPPYDVRASPPSLIIGKKHPYLEFLEEVKEILFAMGFEEASGPYVESEFWNFDALFQAQDHPARAIHDSFQVKGVVHYIDAPEDLVSRVKVVHENGGGTGSKGWGYAWSREIASRPILRSQTTSVSVRYLAEHRWPPVKAFCLSKVFRPDVIDSKHMVEFCQLDGIMGDYGINVKHLLGVLNEFAMELGFKEIKFKPSYFPFTEPSIEAYVRHPTLGWIECLGSGLFRPEVTRPLGIDFPVIAWAFGIDRLAMIRLGVDDIRELHTSNLGMLREKGWF